MVSRQDLTGVVFRLNSSNLCLNKKLFIKLFIMSFYHYSYSDGKFLNLQTYFGFHKIFCDKSDTSFLFSFISAVLEGRYKFKKFEFIDPREINNQIIRDNVSYVSCKDRRGDTYLVVLYGTYFQYSGIDNITIPLVKQSREEASHKRRDCSFKEVISIRIEAIHLFTGKQMEYLEVSKGEIKEGMIQYMYEFDPCAEVEVDESFHIDNTIISIRLPWFRKREDELETMLDKWLYTFRYLPSFDPSFDDRPKFAKKRIFKRLLSRSEVYYFPEEEVEKYASSLFHWFEHQGDTIFSLKRSFARGFWEGFKESYPKAFGEGCMLDEEEILQEAIASLKEMTGSST